nr:MAG TPA: hypothetical protein [Caudoviricetes sp.]
MATYLKQKAINTALSYICGALVNCLLFAIDFWDYETLMQILIISIGTTVAVGRLITYICSEVMRGAANE